MSQKKKIIIFTAGMLFFMGIVLYPFIADIWNQYVSFQRIAQYTESVSSSDIYYEEEYAAAESYNSSLYMSVSDPYGTYSDGNDLYESLLNVNGDGMMGHITIPSINVYLPIYHYTTDEVLEKGTGHLYGSSLPVGGESTHCIISAHRGLPTAKLFSDLDKVEIGDYIYISVLTRTLVYEVYDIETVLPTEVSSLSIQQGEDIITLVTCTPYGVNTHRLLVHAKRIELTEEEEAEAKMISEDFSFSINYYLLLAILAEVLIYIVGVAMIRRQYKESEDVAEEVWNDEDFEDLGF